MRAGLALKQPATLTSGESICNALIPTWERANSIKFKEIVEMMFVLLKTKQGKLKQSTGVH